MDFWQDSGRRTAHDCVECGKHFVHAGSLARHLFSHTGEKPFLCPICGKTFRQRAHLKVHLRSHTGEKPYSCPMCTKRFAYSSDVKKHERCHTGEKPYSCPVCFKAYTQSTDMKRHMLRHVSGGVQQEPSEVLRQPVAASDSVTDNYYTGKHVCLFMVIYHFCIHIVDLIQ